VAGRDRRGWRRATRAAGRCVPERRGVVAACAGAWRHRRRQRVGVRAEHRQPRVAQEVVLVVLPGRRGEATRGHGMPGAGPARGVCAEPAVLGVLQGAARFCTRATRRPATWNVIGWA
jgi:hypothetical protein